WPRPPATSWSAGSNAAGKLLSTTTRGLDPSVHGSAAAAPAGAPASKSAAAKMPNARDLISPSCRVFVARLLDRTVQPGRPRDVPRSGSTTPATLNAREAEKLHACSGGSAGEGGEREIAGRHRSPQLLGADHATVTRPVVDGVVVQKAVAQDPGHHDVVIAIVERVFTPRELAVLHLGHHGMAGAQRRSHVVQTPAPQLPVLALQVDGLQAVLLDRA